MKLLKLSNGDIVKLTNVTLPIGSKITIQPQNVDFLDIDDPKYALEQSLRTFSALTLNDIIAIKYNNKIYELRVIDAEPSNEGISIIETDLQVEFAPPVGYKEPEKNSYGSYGKSLAGSLGSSLLTGSPSSSSGFVSFSGVPNRINGSSQASDFDSTNNVVLPSSAPSSISVPSGTLFFGLRDHKTATTNITNSTTTNGGTTTSNNADNKSNENDNKKWSSFSGKSNKLK